MAHRQITKVAILGAGKGGTCLIDLLHQITGVEIVGIADKNPQAPGLRRATDLKIPVMEQVGELIMNHGVSLIVDVTGDPEIERFIHVHKRAGAEFLGGAAARLLWNLVQHQSKLQAEILHAEKLAGIGSFASGLAHDINNPLQMILGTAENLLDEKDPTVIQDCARDIIEAVRRTSSICRDLTRYSRRSADGSPVMVDINQKLDEALKIAQYAVAFQDVEVSKQYAPIVRVHGNPDEVLHVFVNLITNAVQAMSHGGVLTLKTHADDGTIVAALSDTGNGILPEALPLIFEPFYTTKPPGKGTGLGLYNVKTVITSMGGSIAVDSQVGQGTTFRISWPIPDQREASI